MHSHRCFRKARAVFGAMSFVLMATLLLGCRPPASESTIPVPKRNENQEILEATKVPADRKVPEITGVNGEGKTMKLSDYRGKVVLLDVWFTQCPPCVALFPHEKKLVKRMEGKPFALVGINIDPDRETLAKTEKHFKLNWQSWWDEDKAILTSLSKAGFDLRTAPAFILIDHQGKPRYFIDGDYVKPEVLDHAVEQLVAEANKSVP